MARGPLLALWLAALVAAAAAALAWPLWRVDGPGAARQRWVLLDVSDSVVRPRPTWLPWVRGELARQARAARAAAQSIGVVAYADGTATLFDLGAPQDLLERLAGDGGPPLDPRAGGLATDATDLAAALAHVADRFEALRPSASDVVVVGDGDRGRGASAARLERLAAEGEVTLGRVDVPPAELVDVALRRLALTPDPAVGQPLVAALELEVAPTPREPLDLVVTLAVEDAEGATTRTVALEAPTVPGPFRASVDLGPARAGRTRVLATARRAGDAAPDPLPPNDRARAAVHVAGRRVLGVVAPADRADAALAALARGGGPPGVQLVPLAPDELVAALPTLDAVCAFDLPLGDLPAAALAAAVARGAGFLRLAGWNHRNPERVPGAAPLAPLLALRASRPSRPPRDVLLLVDASGSMAGEPFEQVERAAASLAGAAPADDRLLLRFFSGVLQPTIVLEDASGGDRAQVAERLLGARAVRGPTALLASLEQLAAERRVDDERPMLVLLLTDGREEGDPVREDERRESLRASLAASGTALRALAVGPRADLATLAPLVEAPAHLVRVANAADLATLLVRAVADEDLLHGPFALERAPAPPAGLAREVFAADAGPPPVATLVRSEVADGAEPVWRAPGGEPALALARHGAGRVAALATLPDETWAPALARGPQALWPLVTWLCQRPAGGAPRARVEAGTLVVAGLDPEAPAVLGARVVDPVDGSAIALDLVAADPVARPDERRAPWPPPALGRRRLDLDPVAGLELHLALEDAPVLDLPRPLPAEYRAPQPWQLPTAGKAAPGPPGRPGPLPAWWPAALAALGLASLAGTARLLALRGVKLPSAAGR